MQNWRYKIKLKHLLEGVDENDAQAVHEMLCSIAEKLRKRRYFDDFDTQPFVEALDPEVFKKYGWTPETHANQLMRQLYDFADANAIWVE